MSWVGVRGFWIGNNEYCEITDVIDEATGTYEFWGVYTDDVWHGFIEDFMPEG